MEKSGPGVAYPKIIDQPELKSFFRTLVENSITASLWALMMSWIFPVITLFLWLFGIGYFYERILLDRKSFELLGIISHSAFVFLSILILLAGWVRHNQKQMMKRKGTRRKEPLQYPDGRLAQMFNVDPSVLGKIHSCKRIEAVMQGKELTFILPKNESAGTPAAQDKENYENIQSPPPG